MSLGRSTKVAPKYRDFKLIKGAKAKRSDLKVYAVTVWVKEPILIGSTATVTVAVGFLVSISKRAEPTF